MSHGAQVTPYIVAAELDMSGLQVFPQPFEAFYSRFKFLHGRTESQCGFEGYTTDHVPASALIEVLDRKSEKFSQLTKHSEWRQSI